MLVPGLSAAARVRAVFAQAVIPSGSSSLLRPAPPLVSVSRDGQVAGALELGTV